MHMTSWDKYAEDYFKVDGIEPELTHPAVSSLLGDINRKRLLDFGCGFGDYTRILKDAGADVTGIDTSIKMLEKARKDNPDIEFIHIKECEMPFKENSFGFVVSNFVLIVIDSKEKLQDIVDGIFRVIKPGGRFIFTIPHPCFLDKDHFTVRNIFDEEFDYNRVGYNYSLMLKNSDGSEIRIGEYTDYHYRIQDYLDVLMRAGFSISDFIELSYPREIVERYSICKAYQRFPPYLIIGGRK